MAHQEQEPKPEQLVHDEAVRNVVDAPLLASFTHQIINPLNGVVGTIDNLIDGSISEQRRDQRLRMVRGQLTHAIELIRNLAYLSQLTTEAGRQSLRDMGATSVVPEVIIKAAMYFQELASARGVSIDLEDRHTQYVVRGHKVLLQQVFTNLFENAVKYGDANSAVRVISRPQRKSGNFIVEVINLGPGFSAGEREAIFQRGYRGQEARNVVASGSGLGLYICRDILSVGFDASIEAEHSPSSRTTTFRIRFPSVTIKNEGSNG